MYLSCVTYLQDSKQIAKNAANSKSNSDVAKKYWEKKNMERDSKQSHPSVSSKDSSTRKFQESDKQVGNCGHNYTDSGKVSNETQL